MVFNLVDLVNQVSAGSLRNPTLPTSLPSDKSMPLWVSVSEGEHAVIH